MTPPYVCKHNPRCKCAAVAEAVNAQLDTALNEKRKIRKERDELNRFCEELKLRERSLSQQLSECRAKEKRRETNDDSRSDERGKEPSQ